MEHDRYAQSDLTPASVIAHHRFISVIDCNSFWWYKSGLRRSAACHLQVCAQHLAVVSRNHRFGWALFGSRGPPIRVDCFEVGLDRRRHLAVSVVEPVGPLSRATFAVRDTLIGPSGGEPAVCFDVKMPRSFQTEVPTVLVIG